MAGDPSAKLSRREARRAALLSACGMEHTGYPATEAMALNESMGGPMGSLPEFADQLLRLMSEHEATIEQELTEVLEHWQLSRVGSLERAILRLGCCEILYFPDIPPRVTINEYLELAKIYGDTQSPAFINGILDRIVHRQNKADFISRRPPKDT